MPSRSDRDILRRLATEVAGIAALPIQDEKRRLWKRLNGLRPERPMVMADQVCWNEMTFGDELTLTCEDPECQQYEKTLRRTIYQWKHFPVDRVVDPFINVAKAISISGFGLQPREDRLATDAANDVVAHNYINQLVTDADLEQIRTPVVTHDERETARRLAVATELFDGILELRLRGHDPYVGIWDRIACLMSLESALYALIDRPDFMRELVRRMVSATMGLLDQLENQGLLCSQQSLIHCTGAFTEDLPPADFDARRPRTRDLWMFGLAQMLCTVSPDMFDEFEIQPCMPIFDRFGLVYYGCCDALDHKLDQVRKIRNVRKISISPWANEENGAAGIRGDYVFSRKPNPALLAAESFDEDLVRNHLQTSVDLCQRHGCPLELILKDISTVRYQPQRLWRWAEIAMEVVGA